MGLAQGFELPEIAVAFIFYPPDFGLGLPAVYVAWLAIVAARHPACKWLAAVKARRDHWWLSHL